LKASLSKKISKLKNIFIRKTIKKEMGRLRTKARPSYRSKAQLQKQGPEKQGKKNQGAPRMDGGNSDSDARPHPAAA